MGHVSLSDLRGGVLTLTDPQGRVTLMCTRTQLSQTDRAPTAHTIRRGHLRDLEIYIKGHS